MFRFHIEAAADYGFTMGCLKPKAAIVHDDKQFNRELLRTLRNNRSDESPPVPRVSLLSLEIQRHREVARLAAKMGAQLSAAKKLREKVLLEKAFGRWLAPREPKRMRGWNLLGIGILCAFIGVSVSIAVKRLRNH